MATTAGQTLTANEVAKRLGVTRVTIHRQTKAGKFLPPIRGLGRTLRWDAEALEDWIRNTGD